MNATDLVVLKGGLSVPAAAYHFAIDPEARGLHFLADGHDLVVGPRDRITTEDRAMLRTHEPALRTIAAYQEPLVM